MYLYCFSQSIVSAQTSIRVEWIVGAKAIIPAAMKSEHFDYTLHSEGWIFPIHALFCQVNTMSIVVMVFREYS